MSNNNTLKYRVTQVECRVDKMDNKLDEIMENHLPHLREEIHINNWRIATISAILAAIGGKLLDLFIK